MAIFGKIKGLLNSLKISKQLYMVYFLAGLLPILIVGSYLIINTRYTLLEHHYSQAAADNLRVRNVMLDVTITLTKITDDIFSDNQLQQILKGHYPTLEDSYSACRAYTKINYYTVNYTEISSMKLYVNNNSVYDYGPFVRTTEEIRSQEWYQRAANSVGSYLWMTVEQKGRYGTVSSELMLVRKIPVFGTNQFMVLVIGVNPNFLKSRIDTSPLKTEISINDNPIFYTATRSNNGKMPDITIDYKSEHFRYSGIDNYNGKNELLQISTLTPIGSHDNIYIITIDDEALPSSNSITFICIAIVAFSLLVTVGMVAIFSKTFSSRINVLRREMHKVSCGDFNIIDDFNGNDELVELFTDLKSMIESIKQMDAEIYNAHIAQQKLINHQQEIQFEMLASQINPHFLYNTLETIRMKAHSAGDKEVANAIKLLGKSMRHVLEKGGRPTSLSSELEYISIYLEIQKLRFNNRLDYEIVVDEEINTEKYLILPLLLQPIVENAIIHGLENKISGGFIRINIFREQERLLVSVSDNGVGMQPQELEDLLKHMRGERGSEAGSIGLYNIYQRINLFYGEPYGIEITSEPDKGTCVTAVLPYSHDTMDTEKGKELIP